MHNLGCQQAKNGGRASRQFLGASQEEVQGRSTKGKKKDFVRHVFLLDHANPRKTHGIHELYRPCSMGIVAMRAYARPCLWFMSTANKSGAFFSSFLSYEQSYGMNMTPCCLLARPHVCDVVISKALTRVIPAMTSLTSHGRW